jgi:twitching motility protein PilJ
MAWTMRTKLHASFGIVLFIMAVIGLVNWQHTRSIVAASTRLYDNGETRSAVTVAAEKSARMQMTLLVVAVIAGGGVATILTSQIARQARSIMDTCNQINKADYTARVEVVSKDELGAMGTALNTVLDHTLTLMLQSQQERDSMQASIMKLLEEVTDVAEGDLTLEAEVTEDATGVIADSFNYMIQQLRGVVARVQETTLQVSASANEVQSTAEHLAQGSTVQATQIVESSAAIDEMTESIQQVSEHAALSATVAEQALANARQGTAAVQNTIQGMSRIRAQVQETAKRIKRLGERSQEIGAIVQLIGDIAERTSILALNASIQAARAGEAGRAFVVVAEEVERLAERASNATRQIASLVNTIQSETHEAVIAMEGSTCEVVQGSQLADQAGQALSEIESVSERLADLIQSISHASKQQARSSESLSKAMSEIAAVTQRTAAGTKQATGSINHLAGLADELRHSVSTFKLPVTPNGHNHRV